MKKSLLLVTLLAVSRLTVFSQCNIDQLQDTTDGGRSARNLPGYYEGQTFVPSADGLLCEVAMLMFSAGSGTGTLNIYNGSGIAGNILHTQQVTVNTLAGGSIWQNWTLSNPTLLSAGQTYTLQFVPIQNGGITDPYGVNLITSNLYANGSDLSEPTWDLCFKTYIDVATEINESNRGNFNKLSVYPNPANNSINVRSNSGFQLFSIDGRLLKQSNMPSNTINIEELQEGLYLLKANNQTVKLMVNR